MTIKLITRLLLAALALIMLSGGISSTSNDAYAQARIEADNAE